MNKRTDQQLSGLLAALYADHSALVLDVVTRALRAGDAHRAGDIAHDVWVCVWQYLLRGNTIENPAGLLTTMARHKTTDFYRSALVRREVPVDAAAVDTDEGLAGAPFALAQVGRPTERSADLTDRTLPTLARAVELLRIARRTNDRHGVRLFSRLIDRILDQEHRLAVLEAEGREVDAELDAEDVADVAELRPAPAGEFTGWTAADSDSHQVLASLGAADPAAAVSLARSSRTTGSTARGWAA